MSPLLLPAVRQVLRAGGANPNPLGTHPLPTAWTALPAGPTPPVPALYLLPGRDGEGEGVRACAVVQQDSSNPLALLLKGEGLVPVPSAPVFLRSCAILQAEHDGDFHILIPPILHLPDEHSHRQAGVLAETDNAAYRAGAPQSAVGASLLPLLGRPHRMQQEHEHQEQLCLCLHCKAGEQQQEQRNFGGRQYKVQTTSPGLANPTPSNIQMESSV